MGSKSYPQTVAAAWDKANKVQMDRYWDVLGQDHEDFYGGYAGMYEDAKDAFGNMKQETIDQFAGTEGRLKNDAVGRGLITSKTYGDLGGIAKNRAMALADIDMKRKMYQHGIQQKGLDWIASRTDQPPNIAAAIDTMRQAGAGGYGQGYRGGGRPGYGNLPWDTKYGSQGPYTVRSSGWGGSAGMSDAALAGSYSGPTGTTKTHYNPMNPALAQGGLGPIGYWGATGGVMNAMSFPGSQQRAASLLAQQWGNQQQQAWQRGHLQNIQNQAAGRRPAGLRDQWEA